MIDGTSNVTIPLEDVELSIDGDPVFEYLKSFVLPEFELVGGEIKVNKAAAANQPRKLITMTMKHKDTGKLQTKTFNYKKIERSL